MVFRKVELLFNIMINDIFKNVGKGIGYSLYADDGAIWKRGENIRHMINNIQNAIIRI